MAAPEKRLADDADGVDSRKKHKAKPVNFMDPTSTVTFRIGDGNKIKEFIVHKEVACAASPVFDAAFNSTMIESRTQTYTLTDTTEGAFRFLMQWMYKEKLVIEQLEDDFWDEHNALEPEQIRAVEEEAQQLVNLWILADKLLIPRLQNHAIKVLDDCIEFEAESHRPPIHCLHNVYANTSAGSMLRKFFVNRILCWYGGKYADNVELLPSMALADMLDHVHNSDDVYVSEIRSFYVK